MNLSMVLLRRIWARPFVAFFIFVFAFGLLAQAEDSQCIIGSPKKMQIDHAIKNEVHDNGLLASYQQSFIAQTNRMVASIPAICSSSISSGSSVRKPIIVETRRQSQDIMNKASSAAALPTIKRECFVAAMTRAHGSEEYFCPSQGPRVPLGIAGSTTGACVTDAVVDYTRWAFNEVIQCMSTDERPIDPLAIFALMNNESSLHFFTGSKGGVGIGQLTTSAISAINASGKTALDYIQAVKNSNNPHCAPFKKALNEKLKSSGSGGYCPLINPSSGLARALVYSVSYYLLTRDTLMSSFNNDLQKYGGRLSFANYAAIAMYGPNAMNEQGPAQKALAESKGQFDKFLVLLGKKVPYFQQTLDKADEVAKNIATPVSNLNECLETSP